MGQVSWHAHPEIWALVVGLGVAYAWAARRVGPHHVHPVERPVSRGQIACFYSGLAVLWVAVDWPIHDLAEQLYSVHMVQHTLMALVAAPLLIVGTPGWMLRRVLEATRLMPVARVVTRPLVALALFEWRWRRSGEPWQRRR
jgi:putative membrane protein